MSDNTTHGGDDRSRVRSDGGTVAEAAREDREDRQREYLEQEVNLLNPGTPFMRDHLRLIWIGFVAWVIVVFGPVTATAIAPGVMTSQVPVLDFPLHYFLVAVGGPGGSLVLAFWYTRKRDALDEKYGIEHGSVREPGDRGEVAAADGGDDG